MAPGFVAQGCTCARHRTHTLTVVSQYSLINTTRYAAGGRLQVNFDVNNPGFKILQKAANVLQMDSIVSLYRWRIQEYAGYVLVMYFAVI